jgi:hypothetical protein
LFLIIHIANEKNNCKNLVCRQTITQFGLKISDERMKTMLQEADINGGNLFWLFFETKNHLVFLLDGKINYEGRHHLYDI